MGTLDYVAPEQIVGEPATARTDVYAFGAVLCECLTGVVPFPRENEAAVLYAHLSDSPPRLTERVEALPAGLDDVVSRALSKEPAERYETAGHLMEEAEQALGTTRRLRAIRQPEPVVTPPQKAVLERESAPTDEITDWEGDERTRHLAAARRWSWRSVLPYAAAILLAGAAGAVAGVLTADDGSSDRERESPAVAITPPAGWSDPPAEVEGLQLSDAVGAADGDRGIVAGVVRRPGVSLLPRTLEEQVGGRARSGGEPVTVAGFDARRYAAIPLRGSDNQLTVYAVPTSEGVATVACYAPRVDAMSVPCDEAASSLRIRRGEPYSLTPDPEYGAGVNDVMRDLQKPRRLFRQRLGKATTRYQQYSAAAGLAAEFERAARSLARMRPESGAASAHEDLVRALRDVGSVYRRLERNARAGDAAAFDRVRRQLGSREGKVQGALDALKPLGYTIQ
jgi:hypothetical protein